MNRKTVTISDVAEVVGVSKMTVSNVLSNDAARRWHVSEQTRERVLEAVRKMKYRPNVNALSLRRRRTNIIGFYAGHGYMNPENAYLASIIGGLQEGCDLHKKDLLLHGTFRGHSVADIYAELVDGRLDGLVLYSPTNDPLVRLLADSHLPVIALTDSLDALPTVVVDDTAGGRMQADYLASRSHGYVAYHSQTQPVFVSATRRWQAFRKAARAHGIKITEYPGSAVRNGPHIAVADTAWSGRVGFAVANDELGGDLFQNSGPGQFKNINATSGTATDRTGKGHAGMGIDWGDYDNDGKLDLFVTTFYHEAKCLYHNEGGGVFTEKSDVTGIEQPTLLNLSFGCKFLDADNDGWLDLLIANGHVQDNIEQIRDTKYRQPTQFLHNEGGPAVAFEEASVSALLTKLPPIVGRVLAVGDFDNDGHMDALVVDAEGKPLLLHNETRNSNHWIGFLLIGSGKSNRDALGAMVTVEASGQKRLRQCHPGGSYLSSSDVRIHVGLAGAKRAERVTVRWPDGKTQV